MKLTHHDGVSKIPKNLTTWFMDNSLLNPQKWRKSYLLMKCDDDLFEDLEVLEQLWNESRHS